MACIRTFHSHIQPAPPLVLTGDDSSRGGERMEGAPAGTATGDCSMLGWSFLRLRTTNGDREQRITGRVTPEIPTAVSVNLGAIGNFAATAVGRVPDNPPRATLLPVSIGRLVSRAPSQHRGIPFADTAGLPLSVHHLHSNRHAARPNKEEVGKYVFLDPSYISMDHRQEGLIG